MTNTVFTSIQENRSYFVGNYCFLKQNCDFEALGEEKEPTYTHRQTHALMVWREEGGCLEVLGRGVGEVVVVVRTCVTHGCLFIQVHVCN